MGLCQAGKLKAVTFLGRQTGGSSTSVLMANPDNDNFQRQGAMRHDQRSTSTAPVVVTSLGPALLMGAVSWMLLFALYQWLA